MPIVFVIVPDPVGAGFVESLARPGGNVTGFISSNTASAGNGWSCSGDRTVHDASGVLRDPPFCRDRPIRRDPAAAPSVGVEVSPVDVRDAGEIERDIAAFARTRMAA